MKRRFKIVLAFIVLFESTLIGLCGYALYQKNINQKNVLGATVFVPLNKENLIFSPTAALKYFYEPKPNEVEIGEADWLPYVAKYTVNADALNERYDYSIAKPPNVFRIITLGDSFTFGMYVNTQDTWSERLEDMLNTDCSGDKKYEVINLGVGGYDVQYITHRYKLRGTKYAPDLIIWFESGSGFRRMIEFLQPYIDVNEKLLTQEERDIAASKGDYAPAWTRAVDTFFKTYTDRQILDQVGVWWLDFFQTRGNTPVLITTFTQFELQAKVQLKYWSQGQPNVHVMSKISNIYDVAGFLPDRHPNTKGHEIIAQDTYEYLRENHSIPCQ